MNEIDVSRPCPPDAMKAGIAAAVAAVGVKEWYLAPGAGGREARVALWKGGAAEALAQFARDNPRSSVQALWWKAGDLGLHEVPAADPERDGEVGYEADPIPAPIAPAFEAFAQALNEAADRMVVKAHARKRGRAVVLEASAAVAPEVAAEAAVEPVKTDGGFHHRYGARDAADQYALQPASAAFLRYQQERAEKEEAASQPARKRARRG